MTELIKGWFKENQTLVIFLIAQAMAVAIGAASIIAYYVRMETRVSIMETRGASYTVERLNKMDERIVILEQKINKNVAQLERIVDILTKDVLKR